MAKHVKLLNGDYFGITDEMEGKMEGMWSLNTSPTINPFCQRMQKNPAYICNQCYSNESEARWKLTRAAWAHNGAVLRSRLLQDSEIPRLRAYKSAPGIFRFQAHGDLINKTHYKNLIAITKANPERMFALWTKNLRVVEAVGVKRLPNLVYIYSTPELNKLNPVVPDGFDKVFSVYTRDFAREQGIDINCGGRKCFTCRLCYIRMDKPFVNELVKRERK